MIFLTDKRALGRPVHALGRDVGDAARYAGVADGGRALVWRDRGEAARVMEEVRGSFPRHRLIVVKDLDWMREFGRALEIAWFRAGMHRAIEGVRRRLIASRDGGIER